MAWAAAGVTRTIALVLGDDLQPRASELRPHLLSVAYRLTGVYADAEDIVQDAWLRWHSADVDAIAPGHQVVGRVEGNGVPGEAGVGGEEDRRAGRRGLGVVGVVRERLHLAADDVDDRDFVAGALGAVVDF